MSKSLVEVFENVFQGGVVPVHLDKLIGISDNKCNTHG